MEQEKIAKIIKKIRKQNNLTQKELADSLGVTYQAVSKWENGKNLPDISILKKISEDYKIDIEEFLNGNYSTKNRQPKNILIFTSIIFLLGIIIFIGIIVYFSGTNNSDFEFKTISTGCSNFTISGSLAYNERKSSIYISDVKYCGGDDNTKYNYIECSLYEEIGNNKTLIANCDKGKDSTLEKFLENLQLNVENYKQNCKDYIDNSLYLEIIATNEEHKSVVYKIPLTLNDNCKF